MSSHREKIIGYLALLSSDEALRILSDRSDPERLAFELCRTWFDAIYVPSDSYIEGLRGDRSPEADACFWDAFSDDEIASLERFHRFFELRMQMTPEDLLRSGRIPIGDAWFALTKDAAYLLDDLTTEADLVRREVTKRLRPSELAGAGPVSAERLGILRLISSEVPRQDRRLPPQEAE